MNTDEIKVLPEHLRDGFFGADTSRWKFNKENGLTAEEIEALIPVLRRMNPNTVWAIPEVDFPFGVKTPEIWADGVKIEVKTITDAKKFDRQVRNSKHQIDGGIVVVVDKTGEISLNDIKMAIKNTSNRRGVDNIFVQNGSIKFVTETKEKEVRELPTKGRAIMTSYTSIISQDARKVKELFDKKSQQYYHQTHKLAPESFNKPTKYWEQRSLQRTIEAEKLAKPYLARLRMEYRASSDRAIDQIRRIYETYFGEAGFDRQKLREITPSGDLSRYIKEVRSLGVALPDNYQYRVNREEFLHAQLWLEAQKLGAFEQNISNELYSKVINRSFERTFGDYGGRNAPFYPELSKNDYKKLFQNYSKNWKFEKNYPLSDQEKNILDRFWQETGGRAKIFAVRRVEKPDGVKMPDLIVDGKKVEIKQISSIRSVEAQVRKAQKQGVQGIIFEIKDSKEDPQKLLAEIKKRTAQAGVAEFAVYKNKATAAASYAGHDTVANTFRVAQNPEKVNILPNFARLNEQTMNEILDSKFHGKNFSTRIWGRTDRLAEELHAKLAFAIAKGEGWERTSREIRERFGVAQSSAERLIRTETNYFENRAELAAYQELDIKEFEFLAALDGRTSEICRHHHGKRYKVEKGKSGENIPPLHPNCRSTIVAVVPELESQKAEAIAISQEEKPEAVEVKFIPKPTKVIQEIPQISLNPDLAKHLSADGIRQTEQVLNNMPDAHRNVWAKFADELKFKHISGEGDNYSFNTVNVNTKKILKGDEIHKKFETLLHEYGHGLDNRATRGTARSLSESEKLSNGKTLGETVSDEAVARLNRHQGRTIAHRRGSLKNEILSELNNGYTKADMSSIFDLYGGAIYNKSMIFGVGHERKYWDGPKTIYGVKISKERIQEHQRRFLGLEAFAEMFSATGRRDTKQIELYEKYLPESFKMFNELLERMTKL